MSVIPKNTVRPPALPQAAPAVSPAASTISGAIQRAAQATGASFEYLLATAKVESNLNPNLTARTSSATGLFQFIEQTWLGMMKSTGQTLGFGNYADAISRNSAGRYEVTDARLRDEILQLRRDPAANATMAAAFTQQNAATLGQRIGRPPTDGELYIAHFLGPTGAAKLIETAGTNPQANAVDLFPNAARANQPVFYDRQGQARSVAGVYAELDRRYQVAGGRVASGAPAAATAAVPDTAGTTQALAMAAVEPTASVVAPKPDFRSLFHTGEIRGAVSPVVSELWGTRSLASDFADPGAAADPDGRPLDLFQDSRPDVRGLFAGNGRR